MLLKPDIEIFWHTIYEHIYLGLVARIEIPPGCVSVNASTRGYHSRSKLEIWKCIYPSLGRLDVFLQIGASCATGWGMLKGLSASRMQPRQGNRQGQGGLCAPALSHTPFHLLLYGNTRAL